MRDSSVKIARDFERATVAANVHDQNNRLDYVRSRFSDWTKRETPNKAIIGRGLLAPTLQVSVNTSSRDSVIRRKTVPAQPKR